MNSAKPIFLSLLLVAFDWFNVVAQQPATQATAVVSGRVRVEDGTLTRVYVMLQRDREGPGMNLRGGPPPRDQPPPLTVVPDAEGNYRFNNVPAGRYRLEVHAPVYVKE